MHSHPQMGQMHHRPYPMGHQPHPQQMQHRGYAPMQQQHQPPPPQMHHRPVHQGNCHFHYKCFLHIVGYFITRFHWHFLFFIVESNIVATAFQGVASKIGTGIIEDPLAAFEQIMKEKERRKKERRAALESPDRSRRGRSRSGERRRSIDRRSPRHNSSDSRERGRSAGMLIISFFFKFIKFFFFIHVVK